MIRLSILFIPALLQEYKCSNIAQRSFSARKEGKVLSIGGIISLDDDDEAYVSFYRDISQTSIKLVFKMVKNNAERHNIKFKK